MRPHKKNPVIIAASMAKRLRDEDKAEICASRSMRRTKENIKAALMHSAAISSSCQFYYVDKIPMAVLGIVPQPDGRAVIWMLACRGIENHIGDWMRWFIINWNDYKQQYRQLYNAVYAKNESHLALVRRLDCRIGDLNEHGFIPFWSN